MKIKIKSPSHIIFTFLFVLLGAVIALFSETYAQTNERVDTSSAGLATKVAPGELLPISVKLANFGGSKRVDVLVNYGVFADNGEEIVAMNETVAVETTANFVKTIQIPFDTIAGTYIAKTSIIYEGQLVPATTQFPFIVERKILGFFQTDFFLYGGVIFFVGFFMLFLGRALIKRSRPTRFSPFDYSHIPRDKRVFYELISDTVLGMRQRVGDSAFDIAQDVNGLVIDEKTGRILELTESPSKIIAELVLGYEKKLGKKVSFSFRPN